MAIVVIRYYMLADLDAYAETSVQDDVESEWRGVVSSTGIHY